MADAFSMGVQVVNLILLAALLYIYVSNYRRMKLKYTIGLIFFIAVFLVQTLMTLYFDTSMVMYHSQAAAFNASILEIVKAIGLAILLWISWE